MNINKLSAVVFSPTDTTKKVVTIMSDNLPMQTNMIDITPYSKRDFDCKFAGDELVIFGVPVYGGRVPAPAVERIKQMRGNQTPAVLVATYGNREYEDALLELKNLTEKNGFIVVAAAAFVTEHSIMHSVAQGRPDAEDRKRIGDFSKKLWEKLQSSSNLSDLTVAVKGNMPYREYAGASLKPQTTDACTQCGACVVNCPVNAIALEGSCKTDEAVCISCMRCIKVCPSHARALDAQVLAVAETAFAKKNSIRKETEIFI